MKPFALLTALVGALPYDRLLAALHVDGSADPTRVKPERPDAATH